MTHKHSRIRIIRDKFFAWVRKLFIPEIEIDVKTKKIRDTKSSWTMPLDKLKSTLSTVNKRSFRSTDRAGIRFKDDTPSHLLVAYRKRRKRRHKISALSRKINRSGLRTRI